MGTDHAGSPVLVTAANGQIVNLDDVQALLISLALEAGEMMSEASGRWLQMEDGFGSKKNSVDLVTETDRAVEQHISKRLCEAYPHFE